MLYESLPIGTTATMRPTEADEEFKKWKKKRENRMLDKMTGDPIVHEIDIYSRELCNNSSTRMGERERRTKKKNKIHSSFPKFRTGSQ